MILAKPPPESKIRELVTKLKEKHPDIIEEQFFLLRDESCNYVWNTVSTRSFAPLLDYYLLQKGLLNTDEETKIAALSELLNGIVDNPENTVVINGNRTPLSINYLRRTDNWMSNFVAISILEAFSKHLGERYSDIELALGPHNPWFDVTRFVMEKSAEGMGLIQQLQTLRDGPRAVYLEMPTIAAFFNHATIYELISDVRLSLGKRRLIVNLYPTNYFFFSSEEVGFNRAVYGLVPVLFSIGIPGFRLNPAEVKIDFLDGDFNGSWGITVDYEVTSIDRFRSFFNVGELQDTVANLSAEVLELQRDRKALSEEAEKLAAQLVEEEKARRIYQVRAAQADAVARFLHQTSNLVLQPLASTMIVFEDFIEIITEVRDEWGPEKSEHTLFRELDASLERIQQVYPTAQQVIHGYRELFHAFYEIYVSTKVERDLNQDLRYIETLVKNKYILTEVVLKLELDPDVPLLKLEGGVQSIFLELMHNAARHGAKNILVKSQYEPSSQQVSFSLYDDGTSTQNLKKDGVDKKANEDGLMDARYIIEKLNNGKLASKQIDHQIFSRFLSLEFPTGSNK